ALRLGDGPDLVARLALQDVRGLQGEGRNPVHRELLLAPVQFHRRLAARRAALLDRALELQLVLVTPDEHHGRNLQKAFVSVFACSRFDRSNLPSTSPSVSDPAQGSRPRKNFGKKSPGPRVLRGLASQRRGEAVEWLPLTRRSAHRTPCPGAPRRF